MTLRAPMKGQTIITRAEIEQDRTIIFSAQQRIAIDALRSEALIQSFIRNSERKLLQGGFSADVITINRQGFQAMAAAARKLHKLPAPT